MSLPFQIDVGTCGVKLVTQQETAAALGIHKADVFDGAALCPVAIKGHPQKYRADDMKAAMLEFYGKRLARAEALVDKWKERMERVRAWDV